MYLLEHAEYLKARSGKKSYTSQPAASGPGNSSGASVYDITSGAPVPPGFKTRRAG